jgi:hypothetical protein
MPNYHYDKNSVIIDENKTHHSIPIRYLPKNLSMKDKEKQYRNLKKSRSLYKKGKYFSRPKVASFHSEPSPHIAKAEKLYNVENMIPSKELARKTKCSQNALEKIVSKGRGAYFSSGSRPNQSGESWGLARLGSAITGGPSSIIDYYILHDNCKPSSTALKMATRRCKREGRCKKYTIKNYKNKK